jgi:hypothetical protein
MANSKVSALTAATVINDTDLFYLSQGGADRKVPASLLNGLGRYANVVVVDSGGAGDYTTLAAALAAITDASATNRYGIIVMPGVYNVSAAFDICKEGVDICALIPGTVVLTGSVSIRLGYSTGSVSRSLISGIKFINVGNNTSWAISCSANNSFNAKLHLCEFRKSIGSGGPVDVGGDAASLLEFNGCVMAHDEVTDAAARFAVRVGLATDVMARIIDCDLIAVSTHVDSACLYDNLGGIELPLSVLQSRLKCSANMVRSAGDVSIFGIALCMLQTSTFVQFTNRVVAPGNVVDAGF